MSDQPIRVRHEGAVGIVELARPERRNAFDSAMAEALGRALGELATTDASVVLVRGDGPAFCAGWDLREIAALRGTSQNALRKRFERNVEILGAFADLPQPTIVAAHGAAAGFGLGLLARADIALVADDTHLALPEIAHGIVPALVLLDLAALPGQRSVLEWLLSGQRFSPEDARAAGLATRVVRGDALDDEALALARTLAGHDRATLLATKAAYRRVRALPEPDAQAAAIEAACAALAVSP